MKKQAKEEAYLHILKYTGLFGGVQGLSVLVGIVRNKLIAMILGPDGMGLISLFNSSIKLVSDSTNFGISMSAVKSLSEAFETADEARVRSAIRTIRSWSLLTALLGVVVCVALSPLLNTWTFAWGDHTLHFVLLAPVVGLMALTGGEAAILKAARKLNQLAAISVYNLFFALVATIPLYYYYGQAGIVPSLVLVALGQCLTTVAYSFRLYRPVVSLRGCRAGEGRGLISLGMAFVVAGVLGSGAEFAVRSYMNYTGEIVNVGLYNAGYMMTMVYAGMVFSAMETDYIPRLSAIPSFGARLNQTVNHQMEVSLLLVSPLLVLFMVALPILLPLLYSGKFMPVMGMVRVTALAMYFRALTLPVEYIALSRSDSNSYLFLEAVYDVCFVLLVILGFRYFGLTGTGVGLVVAGAINFVVVMLYARWKYHYHMSAEIRLYMLTLLPLGGATYMSATLLHGVGYWVVGLLLALVSFGISLHILRSKSRLWESLWGKVRARWHRKTDAQTLTDNAHDKDK